MRVKTNSLVPMADIEEPKWTISSDGYAHLILTDPKTKFSIELSAWPNDHTRFLVYILTPDKELYQGFIYDCPLDLAVELLENYYFDAETGYAYGESMTVPADIAAHIVRVMAPGRGLLFGI